MSWRTIWEWLTGKHRKPTPTPSTPPVTQPPVVTPPVVVDPPVVTPPVVIPPATPPKVESYTVQSGDTLSGIAVKLGVTLADLEAANPQITNPDLITVGQVLKVPVGAANPPVVNPPVVTPPPPVESGKISTSQIDFTGAGTWKSGKAACQDYIKQALWIMGITDPTAVNNWVAGETVIAERETAYNSPQWQVNKTDSNAIGAIQVDGAPFQSSRGVAQCIPQTFAAYHQAGTTVKIYDPVANFAASMNYIMAVYKVARDGHDLASKVQQADPNRSPKGY